MIRQDKISYLAFKLNNYSKNYIKIGFIESLLISVIDSIYGSINSKLAFKNLQKQYSSWNKIIEEDIQSLSKSIYPSKPTYYQFATIQNILSWIKEYSNSYNTEFLYDWDDETILRRMLKIKGLRQETILKFLCLEMERDVFPVDSSIHRILTRFGVVVKNLSNEDLFSNINNKIPTNKDYPLYLSMKEHTSKICIDNNPTCHECQINEFCDYFNKKNHWRIYN